MHNAAQQQRDYLFENDAGQTTYQWSLGTGNTTTGSITETIDSLINPNEVAQVIGNTQTGQLYSWTLSTGNINTGAVTTGVILITGNILTGSTGSLDCITPRKEEVKNKDFVLAYAQRQDVNTICNIEKRVCMSGTLWGTFTQRSCRDDVVYIYNKAEVISYNQKVINEYIQPTQPVNAGAEFDTEGKINTTEVAIDKRWTSKWQVTTKPGIKETPSPTKASCTTPRGQKIKHGQFTKAYKAPRGFLDLPCDVQIRACVNGNLKWTYTYAKCTFNNINYSDYLTAGKPTSNTGFLFFQRIKSVVKWK